MNNFLVDSLSRRFGFSALFGETVRVYSVLFMSVRISSRMFLEQMRTQQTAPLLTLNFLFFCLNSRLVVKVHAHAMCPCCDFRGRQTPCIFYLRYLCVCVYRFLTLILDKRKQNSQRTTTVTTIASVVYTRGKLLKHGSFFFFQQAAASVLDTKMKKVLTGERTLVP